MVPCHLTSKEGASTLRKKGYLRLVSLCRLMLLLVFIVSSTDFAPADAKTFRHPIRHSKIRHQSGHRKSHTAFVHKARPVKKAHHATLSHLQIQEISGNTRLIFNLQSSPKSMAIYDEPGKPMRISFQAQSAMQKNATLNQRFNWPNLSGIYAENRAGRTQLFIKRNMTGTVAVKTDMNRVIVTIPHYYYRVNNHNEIAAGVRYVHLTEHSKQGPVQINVLEIDPKNPSVEIMPALAYNRMGSKANVATMVARHQAVAGINGSFFKPDVGTPLGILMIDQELISGPIFDRVALGITNSNTLVMSRIRVGGQIQLPGGGAVAIHNVNQPRVRTSETVLYSPRWGTMAPLVPSGGIQIQLRNNRVTAVSSKLPLPIPRDGMVISGYRSNEMTAFANMNPDQAIKVNVYTTPDWSGMRHAIGGGPWLVHRGQSYIDMGAQHFNARSLGYREPRSALGITRDGKLLLVTVDGRQKRVSVGMTLSELSFLMRKLNAVEAMNLDGGSSTQMSLYGKTVNRPSAGNVGVSNSLIVRRASEERVASKAVSTLER